MHTNIHLYLFIIDTYIYISFYCYDRQSSSREDGWLNVRLEKSTQSLKKWAVFEDGNLILSPDKMSLLQDSIVVSMDRVISIRMDVSHSFAGVSIISKLHIIFILLIALYLCI